jgi:hypothetical protein
MMSERIQTPRSMLNPISKTNPFVHFVAFLFNSVHPHCILNPG